MESKSYGFLALGLVFVAFSMWCRLGRREAARYWVGSEGQERTTLMVLPAFGGTAVLASTGNLTESLHAMEVALGGVLMVAPTVAVGVVG